jgi:hypothetical protein
MVSINQLIWWEEASNHFVKHLISVQSPVGICTLASSIELPISSLQTNLGAGQLELLELDVALSSLAL